MLNILRSLFSGKTIWVLAIVVLGWIFFEGEPLKEVNTMLYDCKQGNSEGYDREYNCENAKSTLISLVQYASDKQDAVLDLGIFSVLFVLLLLFLRYVFSPQFARFSRTKKLWILQLLMVLVATVVLSGWSLFDANRYCGRGICSFAEGVRFSHWYFGIYVILWGFVQMFIIPTNPFLQGMLISFLFLYVVLHSLPFLFLMRWKKNATDDLVSGHAKAPSAFRKRAVGERRDDTNNTSMEKGNNGMSDISVQEVLANTWHHYWVNFGKICMVALMVQILLLLFEAMRYYLLGTSSMRNLFVGVLMEALPFCVTLVMAVFSVVVMTDMSVAGFRGKMGYILGRAFVYLPAGVLTFLVQLVLLGVMWLLIVPTVYFIIAWVFALPAVVLCGKNGMNALSYSRSLISGRWGEVAGYVVLLGIVFFLLSFANTMVLGMVFSVSEGPAVLFSLVSQFTSLLVILFFIVGYAVLFLCLKERFGNADG